MTHRSPESPEGPTLTDRVFGQMQLAHQTLETLTDESTLFRDIDDTDKGRALQEGLAGFAVRMLEEGYPAASVPHIALTGEVAEQQLAWVQEATGTLVRHAVYEAFHKLSKQKIAEQLEGKTITVTANAGHSLGVSDGYIDSYPGPKEFTGPFLNYSPGSGELRVGEPNRHAVAKLFPLTSDQTDYDTMTVID